MTPQCPAALTRRRVLILAGGAACLTVVGAGRGARAASPAETGSDLAVALAASSLVYLTPLHADGRESACQAELWFVAEGTTVFVVTAAGAWRARALQRGLTRARVWIGDVGVWTRADGAYRNLPSTLVRASPVTDVAEHARLLEIFGSKYRLGWVFWGARFRRGLADGSRVMIRYDADASTV